ncbi:SH3 domain-containing protein [Ornithinimicrobium pekingense]|uniref:C40 family peptidase n=1 Tax=Ornithinimicrobium pekingense TaxID=384677 RepID=UPI0003B4900F|nr:SH3 domain-containing protein [Ornithinimicrobium pekingense]
MSSRTRSLSRTLIAVTAATAPVVALAPTASAAPSPQVPRLPQGLVPATPTMPAAPARILPTVEHNSVTRWVSVPVANVRSGPSTSYKVVGTRTQGAAVKGTVTSNGWLKISDTQFIAPSVVSSTDPGAPSAGTAGQTATMYLSAKVGNVRSGAGLQHRVVGTLLKGAEVKGTWTSNGWLKMAGDRYVSGTILTSSGSSSAPAGGSPTAPSTSGTVARWVSVPVANVRRGPSTSHSVVGTKTSGAQVRGTLSSNGWLKISDTQYMAPSVLTNDQPGGSTSSDTSTEVTQYVTAAVANIRSGPGLNHRVVGTTTQGTRLTGTWTSNNWLDLGGGRFISGLILSSGATATPPPASQVVDRWVSVPVANVRSGPSTSYSVVGTKTQGTKVSGEVSNGWLKISATQYMAESVLTATPPATSPAPAPAPAPAPPAPTPLRQALLDTAAQYVGYPYVLYGTPPEAFDCSAYTWWIYKQNGINIPRTVRDQRTFVTPVTDPQPGDLIFYKNYYHVGIYAGNGMTYEAQNPDVDVIYGKVWDRPENVWYGRVPGL